MKPTLLRNYCGMSRQVVQPLRQRWVDVLTLHCPKCGTKVTVNNDYRVPVHTRQPTEDDD